jgi:hypothetical protein
MKLHCRLKAERQRPSQLQLKDMMKPGQDPAKPTSRLEYVRVVPAACNVVGCKAGLGMNIAHSLQQRQPHLLGLVYSLAG